MFPSQINVLSSTCKETYFTTFSFVVSQWFAIIVVLNSPWGLFLEICWFRLSNDEKWRSLGFLIFRLETACHLIRSFLQTSLLINYSYLLSVRTLQARSSSKKSEIFNMLIRMQIIIMIIIIPTERKEVDKNTYSEVSKSSVSYAVLTDNKY